MATRKKANQKETDTEESVSVEETPAEPAPKPVPVPVPKPKVKKVTFTQYAVLKNIPERHRPGLKAFVKFPQKKRSIEEWEKCFKDY